jgi:hypothetical protein
MFLEIIRERFTADANLNWTWKPDITETDIVIEASYNEETESRNETPAVYVTRQNTVPARVVVGDRAGVRLPDHLEGFAAYSTSQMQVEVVSNDEGESAVLGDIIQFMLLASQDVIQREFGLHDFTHPTLGPTQPSARDVNKWSTTIDFQVSFWIRWTQVPIAPLLQQIVTRIDKRASPDSHFQRVTLDSLGRHPVVIAPSDPACSAPCPPGPAGPAGPPGPPGTTVYLRMNQPLTGGINSVNTVYSTAPAVFLHDAQRQEMFYINGVRQKPGVGNDYVVSESAPGFGYDTITVAYAPKPGDVLTVDYYAGP